MNFDAMPNFAIKYIILFRKQKILKSDCIKETHAHKKTAVN